MVANLLRLKLTLLRNSLRRGVAVIVGMVFGVLYGGVFLLAGVVGLVALRFQDDPGQAATAVVLGGCAMVLAWALLPVLLFGADPTLDPARFATFAVPERRLAVGLVLAGLVGLPGLASVLLVLGGVVATSRSLGAVGVALLGGTAGLMTCVLASRIVTGAASAVLATRRGRDLAGVSGLVLVVAIWPLSTLLGHGGPTAAQLAGWADVLGWTPVGWAWAAAADASVQHWATALLRLLLALGLCVALLELWRRLLVAVLRNPRPTSGDRSGPSGLGLLGWFPGTPMGAVAARAGTYWVRDPRLNVPALMTMLVPAMLLIPGLGSGSWAEVALVAMPLASAYLVGWGQHNDVGYDSTAFWMHVASGMDGRSDRLGRLFPSFAVATVCIPAYSLLGPIVGGPWRLLPATFGAAVGIALNGFAVSCVVSAVKQYAVPAPGENPFSGRPGSVGVTLAVQSLCGAAVLVLSLPALALGAMAWFGWEWAAFAALVVGPVLGAVAFLTGVRVGAEQFRLRQADLLQDLVAMS